MADFESILKAAPIGLLMFFGTYLASKRRQSGRARAAKELPELARRLGLESRKADPGGIGALSGDYEGYRVYVDPDERPRIVVYFANAPAVALRTYEHEKRVPPGMVSVLTDNDAVDRFFRDRYASPERAAALHDEASAFERLLEPFTGRWNRNVAHVSVTSERLECALDFGRPSYIPKEAVESLLPGAVALARFLEGAEKTETD
jgi:hypothetical protein